MEEIVKENKIGLFDFLNDIYLNKQDLLNEDNESQYSPFMINKFLSGNIDTLLVAKKLNLIGNINKFEHYKFLLKSIPKRKRFSKYLKAESADKIGIIKEYYDCNESRAKEILTILTGEDIASIEKSLDKGGTKKKFKDESTTKQKRTKSKKSSGD